MDHAAAFSKMSSTEFISTMISSKDGDAAECQAFATNVISDIGTSVDAEQDLLDAIDTGSGCASEGQEAVTKAQAALTTAQDNLAKSTADLASALNAKVTTCTAPVVLGVSIRALGFGTCYDYSSDPSVVTARSVCASFKVVLASADKTATTAQTKADDAQTAITDAEAEAARLQKECHCRVSSQQTEGWAGAQRATSTHEVEWKKAHEVLCALHKSSTSCVVATLSTLTQPTVADGVNEEQCKEVEEVTSEPTREPISESSVFPGEWRDGKCLALRESQSVIQSLVLSSELTKEEATASCKKQCDALDNCVYANLQLGIPTGSTALWPQRGHSNRKCENTGNDNSIVADRAACQATAVAAGADWYSFRADAKKCFYSTTCSSPITGTTFAWNIFSTPSKTTSCVLHTHECSDLKKGSSDNDAESVYIKSCNLDSMIGALERSQTSDSADSTLCRRRILRGAGIHFGCRYCFLLSYQNRIRRSIRSHQTRYLRVLEG